MAVKLYDLSQPFYAGIPLWPWPVMYDVEVSRVTFPEYATFPDAPKPQIKKGDFVVVNTGWHKYFPKQGYIYFNHFPGFYTEAADWFIEHEVKAVANDGGATEHPCAHT